MCCCGQPNVNGTPGYSWDGKSFGTRPIDPPALAKGDTLIYDEPGRCGGVDSHAYHFRVVRNDIYGEALLVKHGAGEDRINLGRRGYFVRIFPTLGSNDRYWLMQSFYHLRAEAMRQAAEAREYFWRQAIAEKRVKTRKVRGGVKITVVPKEI